MTYVIKYVYGHYEVYSTSGKFIVSGDTYDEALYELREMDPEYRISAKSFL